MRDVLELPCSSQTVVHSLHQVGLHHCQPAKIYLTNEHAQRRLAFAQESLNRDWGLVIFCDEKGWMSSTGPGELVRTIPLMTAAEYVDILQDVLLPNVEAMYLGPHQFTFMHDSSAVYKARMFFCCCSAWNDVEEGHHVHTRDQLYVHAQTVWGRFRGQNVCENLVASLPICLEDVIGNNGFWTRY
ncbi:hypothetical protein ILUMI_12823 [Ignelater luminosus]|uniref:Transposase Tc1-like domain-containing protein n=1 Tax=Ignelater luminosus TaxID=2038154 RepID=A0A8K0G977_IGNLU|nr:hypothetical protein ILUMI_12823 [Ignelater luminosus]